MGRDAPTGTPKTPVASGELGGTGGNSGLVPWWGRWEGDQIALLGAR